MWTDVCAIFMFIFLSINNKVFSTGNDYDHNFYLASFGIPGSQVFLSGSCITIPLLFCLLWKNILPRVLFIYISFFEKKMNSKNIYQIDRL